MMWLAALMGVLGVGAVTFIDTNPEDEDEAEATSERALGDQEPQNGTVTESGALIGSDEADILSGGDGDDHIAGLGGDDTITGAGGNDYIHGNDGDDDIWGGNDDDLLNGDDGDDALMGDDGDDVIFGHNDTDTLYGGAGNDTLQGSAGNDLLHGGTGDDVVHGGLDNDTLTGGTGEDSLFGGYGDDLISGVEFVANHADTDTSDFLNGGQGNDTLIAGAGDIVTAGDGADLIVLGDWIEDGHAARITDYSVEDDSILVVWDDTGALTEPEVEVVPDPDTEGQSVVILNGTIIAQVNGTDISLAEIVLMPMSSALDSTLFAA